MKYNFSMFRLCWAALWVSDPHRSDSTPLQKSPIFQPQTKNLRILKNTRKNTEKKY